VDRRHQSQSPVPQILDEDEAGRRFLLHRRDPDVCTMIPLPVLVAVRPSALPASPGVPVVPESRCGDCLLDILTDESGVARVGPLIGLTVLMHAERRRQTPAPPIAGLMER